MHPEDAIDLQLALDKLSADTNKWVRIKAQRALSGGKSFTERISPLSNACINVLNAADRDPGTSIWQFESDIMYAIRLKLIHSVRLPPTDRMERVAGVLLFGASRQSIDHDIDTTPGWKGDEMYVAQMKYLASDRMNALIACWPNRGERVFALVVDETFPEYLGVHSRIFDDSKDVLLAVEALSLAGGRGESQSVWLMKNDWPAVLPQPVQNRPGS